MRTALLLLSGALSIACSNDFDEYRFRSGGSATGGTGATGGAGAVGGSGGSGGTSATGGTGGATGGTGGATGGAGGATGGTGGATGGTGGATGGAGGATGGAGGATGGAAGSGGVGGAAGAAGQGGTGGTVATCEKLYQGKPGVNSICLDNAQVCELNFSSGSATCTAICAAGGGECQGVFDNNGPCNHGQGFTCGTNVLNDGVCVCSHGCGSGPPCPTGQTCTSGSCN